MINVRACVSDKGDIFDGPNADEQVGSTLEERLDFVEKQEKFTQDYQGEAFRTYLAKRFADKRAEATLKSYMDRNSWMRQPSQSNRVGLAASADFSLLCTRVLPRPSITAFYHGAKRRRSRLFWRA